MKTKKVNLFFSFFIFILSAQLVVADTDGVWHDAEDVRSGVFASDEDGGDFFFTGAVGINTETPLGNLTVNGTIVSNTSISDSSVSDLFIDKSDSSFYLDPAGLSQLNKLNMSEGIFMDAISAPKFLDLDDTSYYLDPYGYSTMYGIYVQDLNAEIIYDYNGDTTYYLDIAGNSNLKNVDFDTVSIGGVSSDTIYVNENQANSISSAMIINGAIVSADIADGTIASVDIANGAIVSADIADGTITSADIANGAIVSADIADGTIASVDIANGAIVSADIADGTITSGDIATGGVTSSDIADGTITSADIDLSYLDNLYVDVDGDSMSGSLAVTGTVSAGTLASSGSITLGGTSLTNMFVSATSGGVMVGNYQINGDLVVSGTINGQTFAYTSDEKLKENVETLDNSLEVIKNLRGVSFDWIESGNSDLGFIAQEVEQVVPGLVITDSETDLKSVKYGNMVALLVEAVKEQQDQIDELRNEVERLNNK